MLGTREITLRFALTSRLVSLHDAPPPILIYEIITDN